jgi:hypothetical protein
MRSPPRPDLPDLVVLAYFPPNSAQARALFRCKDDLVGHGVRLTTDPTTDGISLILCHRALVTETLIDGGKAPVVLIDHGSQLGKHMRERISRVQGVIKNSMFVDRGEYNRTRERHHVETILKYVKQDTSAPRFRSRDRVSESDLAKLHLGFSLATYRGEDIFTQVEVSDLAARPYDVFFAGNATFKSEPITWHRQRAVESIQKLRDVRVRCEVGDHPLSKADYCQVLLESKVVVSPWGWWEACYRDYEAFFCGCKVVKPDTRHIVDASGVFPDAGGFYWCEPDFSDLQAAVDKALNGPADLKPREMLLAERAGLAEKMAGVLRATLI